MSNPERAYMCQEFCGSKVIPCLLQNIRQALRDEADIFGGPTREINIAANKIAGVCKVVARELPTVDEFII